MLTPLLAIDRMQYNLSSSVYDDPLALLPFKCFDRHLESKSFHKVQLHNIVSLQKFGCSLQAFTPELIFPEKTPLFVPAEAQQYLKHFQEIFSPDESLALAIFDPSLMMASWVLCSAELWLLAASFSLCS